jgi:DNA-binding transcriptional regulator YdaS (Cro superfamily)
MADLMTEADVLRDLSQKCELAGGQAAWAQVHGVSRSQLCEVIAGRRSMPESIANAAGYVRVTRFVPMRGKPNA